MTLFNRGQTRPELFGEVEKLRGDRDGDLDALRGRSFDAVVDTSGYVPRIVRETLDALGDVGHYPSCRRSPSTRVSRRPPRSSRRSRELEQPTEEWREAYGELKALCEAVVQERFPDAFIPVPGLISGRGTRRVASPTGRSASPRAAPCSRRRRRMPQPS